MSNLDSIFKSRAVAVTAFNNHVSVCSVAELCLILCNPEHCSPPGSSVHGIFQATILEWIAISYSRGSSQPRDQTHVSCISRIGRQILYRHTSWEAPFNNCNLHKIREWTRPRQPLLGSLKYERIFSLTSWVHQVGLQGKKYSLFCNPTTVSFILYGYIFLKYLLIWLHQVLAVACSIEFPEPGIRTGSPALGA